MEVNNVINFDPPEKKLHITELLISYVIDRMSIFTTMVSYDWLILAVQYSWEFITLFSKNILGHSVLKVNYLLPCEKFSRKGKWVFKKSRVFQTDLKTKKGTG